MTFKLWDFSDHRIQSIVFKLTEACNLACRYCYRQDVERTLAKMPLEVIEKSISSFIEWNKEKFNGTRTLYLIWHGGEPLVLGKEYFHGIYKIVDKYKKMGQKINTSFQTNATLIDQEWVDFFKEHEIIIGISIDGTKEVHDVHRMDRRGNSAFEKILNGIHLLRKNNYPYSGIGVLSNETVDQILDSFSFLVQEGFSIVDFIPCFLYDDPATLDGKKYASSVIKLYDYWKEHYEDKIRVRFLADIEDKILGKAKSIGCELAGYCGENFSIGTNGAVFPCECISIFPEFCIGNINTNSFSEMLDGEAFEKWKHIVNCVDDRCINECPHFSICRAGCFNRRYMPNGSVVMDRFCESRKAIIEHIKSKVSKPCLV